MSLLKNSIWNIGGYVIPTLIAVPAFGYIARTIGVELFGLYTLAMVIVGYASIFDGGLTRAVVREIAINKNDDDEKRAIVTTASISVLIFGIIGGGLLYINHDMIIHLLKISTKYNADVINALLLIAIGVPTFLVTQIWLAILEGEESFALLNIQKSIGNSLVAGLPALFAFYSATLSCVVGGMLLARFFCLLLSYLYVRKDVVITFRFIKIRILKRLITYGGWITVSNIISPIISNMDRFIISHFIGASKISFYTIPCELINRLSIVPGALGKAVFPRLSQLKKKEDILEQQKKAYVLMTFICLPILVFFFVFSKYILVLWMGPEYGGQSVVIMQIMLIGLFVNCYSQIPFANIQAMGKAHYTAITHAIEFVPYLVALLFCSKYFGLTGVSIAWTIRVIIDFIILYSLNKRCNGFYK